VLDALRRHDPVSTAATLPAARASREIVRHLWDTLPDESEAFVFASPRDLVSRGAWCLDRIANPAVTLHLGWDDMCFRSTLRAAWSAWPEFASSSTDAFNCCIYPDSFDWHIVCAGVHLYPMDNTSEASVLMRGT